MIYIFYTSLALAAIVSIGTIKAQMAHIKGLKGMYKEESRKAHALQLEALNLNAQLRECTDAKTTWARHAHELAEELNNTVRNHEAEIDTMASKIWEAEQFMHRVREQKRRHMQKKRKEAKNASN